MWIVASASNVDAVHAQLLASTETLIALNIHPTLPLSVKRELILALRNPYITSLSLGFMFDPDITDQLIQVFTHPECHITRVHAWSSSEGEPMERLLRTPALTRMDKITVRFDEAEFVRRLYTPEAQLQAVLLEMKDNFQTIWGYLTSYLKRTTKQE